MGGIAPVWDSTRSSQWRRHLQAQQQPIGLQAAAPAALPPALAARVCCCAPGGECCCGTAEECCDGQGFCQVSQHSTLSLGESGVRVGRGTLMLRDAGAGRVAVREPALSRNSVHFCSTMNV